VAAAFTVAATVADSMAEAATLEASTAAEAGTAVAAMAAEAIAEPMADCRGE
jgi:carbon monoxide dehydrogenase subunit G